MCQLPEAWSTGQGRLSPRGAGLQEMPPAPGSWHTWPLTGSRLPSITGKGRGSRPPQGFPCCARLEVLGTASGREVGTARPGPHGDTGSLRKADFGVGAVLARRLRSRSARSAADTAGPTACQAHGGCAETGFTLCGAGGRAHGRLSPLCDMPSARHFWKRQYWHLLRFFF